MDYTISVNENLLIVDYESKKIKAVSEGQGEITITTNGYSKVFYVQIDKVEEPEPEVPPEEVSPEVPPEEVSPEVPETPTVE